MYAINHAATALVVKKQYPTVPLVSLLLSVQLMEVLWVIFHYLGIEHITLQNGVVQLGYLPFSHSIVTGIGLAFLAWLIFGEGFRRPALGLALAIGIASHLFLDLIMHRADIALAPVTGAPVFGLGVYNLPALAFLVETGYGLLCWWIYKGSKTLLAIIIVFNLINFPLIFQVPFPPGMSLPVADFIVTTLIAGQIVLTWVVVWAFSRRDLEGKGPATTAPAR